MRFLPPYLACLFSEIWYAYFHVSWCAHKWGVQQMDHEQELSEL